MGRERQSHGKCCFIKHQLPSEQALLAGFCTPLHSPEKYPFSAVRGQLDRWGYVVHTHRL